jgi:C1A family cysteine protease
MTTGHVFGSRVILAVVLMSCVTALGANTNANIQVAGIAEMTPEESVWMQRHCIGATRIRPNTLALERLNAERRRAGLDELDISVANAVPVGHEVVAAPALGESPDSNRVQTCAISTLSLPTAVDNSAEKWFPPIRSQLALGSCVAFATAYYQFTYEVAKVMDWDAASGDNAYTFSPKWPYTLITDERNAGTNLARNYGVLRDHGCATWADFPYDGDGNEWCLDPNVWRRALRWKLDQAFSIPYLNTSEGMLNLKTSLANGYTVGFDTAIYAWVNTAVKDDPTTPDGDPFVGELICAYRQEPSGAGHFMTFVGYDDRIWCDINTNGVPDSGERGAFKVANSHGPHNGNRGFRWVAYDAMFTSSQVTAGPNPTNRVPVTTGGSYFTVLEHRPSLCAKVTVNHAKRNEMRLSVGVSGLTNSAPESTWSPYAFNDNPLRGGPLAFDGSTNAVDGTFVLDISEICPSHHDAWRFWLQGTDVTNGSPLSIMDFSLLSPWEESPPSRPEDRSPADGVVDADTGYAWLDWRSRAPVITPLSPLSPVTAAPRLPVRMEFEALATSVCPTGAPPLLTRWYQLGGPVSASLARSTGTCVTAHFEQPGLYEMRCEVTDGLATSTWDFAIWAGEDPRTNSMTNALAVDIGFDESEGAIAMDRADFRGLQRGGLDGCTWMPDGGRVSGCVFLDGVDDGVRLNRFNYTVYDIGNLCSEETHTLWFKPEDNRGTHLLYELGGGGQGRAIYLAAGSLYFGAFGDGSAWVAVPVTTGQWYHAAWSIRDGGTCTAYLNGFPVGSSSTLTAIGRHSDQSGMGRVWENTSLQSGGVSQDDGLHYSGMIDEFRLYERALTLQEVRALCCDNAAPRVSAGPDTHTSVGNAATLAAGIFDSDGESPTLQWVDLNQTGDIVFGDPSSATTAVSCATVGLYSLRLIADDGRVRTYDDLALAVTPSAALDSDVDGIPDLWEVVTFGDVTTASEETDFDNDGQSDHDECVADTDARDPLSLFRIIKLWVPDSQNILGEFSTVTSRWYTVLTTTDLVHGAWTALPSFSNMAGTSAGVIFSNSFPSGQQRFYQIQVHQDE